jgi:hypothetical protein
MADIFPPKIRTNGFEALSVIVYRPSSIKVVDEHHRQLTDKVATFRRSMISRQPSRLT